MGINLRHPADCKTPGCVRRCTCGVRPLLSRSLFKPRPSWDMLCTNWHCATRLARSAPTPGKAVIAWRKGQVRPDYRVRADTARRVALGKANGWLIPESWGPPLRRAGFPPRRTLLRATPD